MLHISLLFFQEGFHWKLKKTQVDLATTKKWTKASLSWLLILLFFLFSMPTNKVVLFIIVKLFDFFSRNEDWVCLDTRHIPGKDMPVSRAAILSMVKYICSESSFPFLHDLDAEDHGIFRVKKLKMYSQHLRVWSTFGHTSTFFIFYLVSHYLKNWNQLSTWNKKWFYFKTYRYLIGQKIR